MFCPNCGKPIPHGAAICPACGAKLSSAAPAQGQQPADNAPTNAYDSLGTSYQTPRTVVEGQSGKSSRNAPKKKVPTGVIVAVVVVLCLLLCIVFRESIPGPIRNVIPDIPGITQHAQTTQTTGLDGAGDGENGLPADTTGNMGTSTTGSGDNTNGDSSSSTSYSDSGSTSGASAYEDFMGTWTGTLQSDPTCYGSQINVPVITINSVDDSGRVNFDVMLNFHNHDYEKNGSADGDEMLEFKNLSATIQNNSFSYKFDVTESGDSARLTMKVTLAKSKTNPQMTAEIESSLSDSYDDTYHDTYLMSKQSQG